ncbi:MAG: PTS sugar transporter subunit IIC [Lachnospiraceae bacterium]|nr:PTS sugar transporter subunit IIC [Lachnospiraceae bacterium]
MNFLQKLYQSIFEKAMQGLTLGLFASVVLGTILEQIGIVVGGEYQAEIIAVAMVIKKMVGVCIGVGVATKLDAKPLVCACAAVVGYVGAFSQNIFDYAKMGGNIVFANDVGEPITAFVAAYVAVCLGSFIASKTKIDYIITPVISIIPGIMVAKYVGHPVSMAMKRLGEIIDWSTTQNPVIMGMVIAVFMGLALTFPISSIAIAIALNLTGQAAGAAAIGCCVNMVGFAAASFKDNKFDGFLVQSIGTSTVQMPNIIKNPAILIPVVATSAVLGPVAICVCGIVSTTDAAGVGSCAFMAQISTYKTMIELGNNRNVSLVYIMLMTFILPAIMSWVISEGLRKKGLIKDNDMSIII